MAIAAGAALLLFAAPLMFGSTSRPALLALALGTALLALAAMAAGARPAGGQSGWMAALLSLGLLQLVPLPPALLRLVSPVAARYREAAGAALKEGEGAGDWRPLSLDPHATLTGLMILASACCLFGAVRFALARPAARGLVVGTLIASGVLQAAYGVGECLSGRQQILGWPKLYYTDSATGTFVNRNHFAGYLEMTLMLCLGAAISLAGAARAPLGRALVAIATPRGAAGLLAGAGACVIAAGLLLSRSRAGAVSAAAGLTTLVWLSGRGARRLALASTAAMAAVACVYAFSASPAAPIERFARAPEDFAGPEGRLPVWRDATRMASLFPLTGAGLGSFEHVFPAMRTHDSAQLFRHAHNDYLETAAELGLPGLLLCLSMLAIFMRRAAAQAGGPRDRTGGPDDPIGNACVLGGVAAVASLAVHSLFDFNLHVPANLLTLSAVAALALPVPGHELRAPRRLRSA